MQLKPYFPFLFLQLVPSFWNLLQLALTCSIVIYITYSIFIQLFPSFWNLFHLAPTCSILLLHAPTSSNFLHLALTCSFFLYLFHLALTCSILLLLAQSSSNLLFYFSNLFGLSLTCSLISLILLCPFPFFLRIIPISVWFILFLPLLSAPTIPISPIFSILFQSLLSAPSYSKTNMHQNPSCKYGSKMNRETLTTHSEIMTNYSSPLWTLIP